jgi:hypothetical protein
VGFLSKANDFWEMGVINVSIDSKQPLEDGFNDGLEGFGEGDT